MARQNNINQLPNLDFNHKENLFGVEIDADGQYYYDLSDSIYTNTEVLNPQNFIEHEITAHDNLYSLSMEYYNTNSLWWVIATFNNIDNPFTIRRDVGGILRIPTTGLVGSIVAEIRQ